MFDVMLPAGVFQPIDTQRIKNWDKVSNITKTGRLTEDSSIGQGDAPGDQNLGRREWQADRWFRHAIFPLCQQSTTPTRLDTTLMIRAVRSIVGQNCSPKTSQAPLPCWNVPQIGSMDAAMGVEALGLIEFGDKGDMTKEEIDFLVNFLIEKKQAGHFRAFWETFGQSVNLMVSGEVVLLSMWSPAVTAVNAEGVSCVYASPKEGMRGWHGCKAISAKAERCGTGSSL